MKKIALPPTSADVTLEDLKYEDGTPVEVQCRPVEPEVIWAAWESLPGGGPVLNGSEDVQGVAIGRLVTRSTPIIEAGAFLENGDALSSLVPISALTVVDRSTLLATISKLSGITSKTIEGVRFRHDHGSGLEGSGGTGLDGGAVREDAVGTAPTGD